ncbi:MAG: chemotaxis protein, partial [Lachnospiraceae bacterium]|nr:chemotaxis protein [Lachnospiraceae bacterium]
MAKRKPEEPPKGAPAWQATFADLMNLLLCFFVMLFSMSTMDAQKFELLAASFNQTFSIFSGGASAIGDGLLMSNGVSQLNELDDYINSTGRDSEGDEMPEDLKSIAETMEQAKLEESEQLAENIEEALEEENLSEEID